MGREAHSMILLTILDTLILLLSSDILFMMVCCRLQVIALLLQNSLTESRQLICIYISLGEKFSSQNIVIAFLIWLISILLIVSFLFSDFS